MKTMHTASLEPSIYNFNVAAFGMDGDLIGMDTWSYERLSQKWLAICKEYLAQHGLSFDEPWSGSLSYIRTKRTAVSGTGLVTFCSNGRIVASLALASGASQVTEKSVLEIFVNSLRQSEAVRAAARSNEPFKDILNITQRPLMIVVPWADDLTSDQDHSIVRELSIHLAAAFFLERS